MSETTAEDTTEGTGSVELRGVHLDLTGFGRCRNQEALVGRGLRAFGNSQGFGSERRKGRWRIEKAWKKRLTAGVFHRKRERGQLKKNENLVSLTLPFGPKTIYIAQSTIYFALYTRP